MDPLLVLGNFSRYLWRWSWNYYPLATRWATVTRTLKSLWLKQELHTRIALFCSFLCHHCMTITWNSLTDRFMEYVNTPRRSFLSPSINLGLDPQEFKSREIHLHSIFKKTRFTMSLPSPSSWLNIPMGYLSCNILTVKYQLYVLKTFKNGPS